MKLRQKLAMVLASAMILTAVPVTTMAASKNGFNKTISMVEGTEVTTNGGLFLNVDIDGTTTENVANRTFFLNAEDFEFADQAAYNTITEKTGIESITVLSETQIKVVLSAGVTSVNVPIAGIAKKGTPAIIVDGEDSIITSGKYAMGGEVVTDKVLAATAGTIKNISVDGQGQIADVIIEEKVTGALTGDTTIFIKLPNKSDLEFDASSKIEVEGLRGLAGEKLSARVDVVNGDEKVLAVKIMGLKATNARGSVKIKGIEVKAENPRYEVKTGDVNVKVVAEKADKSVMTETELHVATVANFGVTFNVKEEVKPVAGRGTKKVQVTLDEKAIGTLDNRHDVFFELDGAEVVKGSVKLAEDNKAKVTLVEEINAKDSAIVDGFVMDLANIEENKTNKVVFEFEVQAKAADAGEIALNAECRSFEEDMTIKIGEVQAAVAVETEATTVKVGLQGQVGGQVVITETEGEMLPRGEQIVMEIVDGEEDGIRLVDAKVEAEDIQIQDVKIKDGKIYMTIKRESNELGKITVSDIKIDTNRMVPEGKYDLAIGGEAISVHNNDGSSVAKHFEDTITVKDFVVVGTPNTEDNAGNGLAKGEASFKVGEAKFILNGKEVEMDATPYMTSKNRVMVPVRYVTEAFGITGNNVLFSNENGGTITLFAGGRVLQLTNGSNTALVNGVKVPMDEQVTIKDGRTYIPMGEVARLLDVQVTWDNTAKTASFKN